SKDALHFLLGQRAAKKDFILAQGDTKDLVGVWLSENGTYWKWYPWWGGPIDVDRPLRKVWIIPCGPGLSGEASYLQWTASPLVQTIPSSVQDHQVQIQFPFPVQLVLIDQNHPIYLGEQITAEHRIPLSNFDGIQSPVQVYWQNEAGFWGSFRLNWKPDRPVSDI
ncbi:MAG TPA: hypothetical protein DDW50_22925, partial [Firmicutes bacterium]|nr:hypothetical protein [Bacillota bacterium]